jgi:peptide chain release factor
MTINKDDVIESFVRSSGPGGQNVNKVATCVVLIHKPSGIIIKCQKHRSQYLNRKEALASLHQVLQQKAKDVQRRLKAAVEKQRRKDRRPSRSAKERVLEQKKKRALKKRERKPVAWES